MNLPLHLNHPPLIPQLLLRMQTPRAVKLPDENGAIIGAHMAASALAVVQLAGGPNVARERLLAHFGVSAASEAEDAVPVLRGVAVAVVGDAGVEGGGEESQAVERGGWLVGVLYISE